MGQSPLHVSTMLLEATFATDRYRDILDSGEKMMRTLDAYSGVIRPPIPKVSGHPFRFYPATDSGASGHPVM